jgi:hypothetical protein
MLFFRIVIALYHRWSMIFSENRHPLAGIMLSIRLRRPAADQPAAPARRAIRRRSSDINAR